MKRLLSLIVLLLLVPSPLAAQGVGNFKWMVINGVNVTVGSGVPSGGSNGDVYIRTNGQLYTKVSGVWTPLAAGGSGTVTSIALTMPGIFSVSGSPVTSSGTIAVSSVSQSANTVYASPNGSSGAGTFRKVVFGDWASNSCATGQIPKYDGAAWVCDDDAGAASGAPSAAQYLTLATDATLTNERVLTAGTGVAFTDGGAGSTLTVAADGPNITGVPISTGISGLGTGVATFLATPSSANLGSAVTGETGSGALVFGTSPTLTTPALGTPTALTLTSATGLPLTGLVAASDDQTIVSSGSAFVAKTLPSCTDTGGNHLNYDQSTNAFSCGTSGSGGGGGSGTVTHTGALTSGQLIKGNGTDDITVGNLSGDVTTSGSMATTIANSAVTLAKIANAAANSKLLGSGASGSGSAYAELTLGSNLSMSGTTLNASGGSGGNITSTSAFASPPGSPASGDLWLPSDGFALYRYSGSAWVPWGVVTPMNLANAPTTWVNQSTSTISTTSGPHVLTSNLTSTNLSLRVKTAPSTPYTVTVAINAFHGDNANAGVLVGFRDSASGKIVSMGVLLGGSAQVNKWNSATSYNSTYITTSNVFYGGYQKGTLYLQIADDGASRYCRFSVDQGATWRQLHTVGRTDFLTADQVFWGVDNEGSTFPTAATLLSWVEN